VKSVNNLTRNAGTAGAETGLQESAKDVPPTVPMSDTSATLHEHPTSPHVHRPYYCIP
jgi:hypothetical protein